MIEIEKIILGAFLLSFLITHYFEVQETKIIVTIKKKNKDRRTEKFVGDCYRTAYSFAKEPQVNPVHVSQKVKKYVDEILSIYKENKNYNFSSHFNEEVNDEIVKVANFLYEYADKLDINNNKYFRYAYNFNYPSYDKVIPAPWYSGMAQGLAIETMLGAYLITEDKRFLNAARFSANTLELTIEDGGVAVNFLDDSKALWFEEYAHPKKTPPLVLNGHNFALIGLGKLVYFDNSYVELYFKGLRALKTKLYDFDKLLWSRYDLEKYMANQKYHCIHINQLNEIGKRNNDKDIIKYSRKFLLQKLLPFGTLYRIIFYPHRSLILIYSFNFLLSAVLFCTILFLGRV